MLAVLIDLASHFLRVVKKKTSFSGTRVTDGTAHQRNHTRNARQHIDMKTKTA
jgi:hypothetical protein